MFTLRKFRTVWQAVSAALVIAVLGLLPSQVASGEPPSASEPYKLEGVTWMHGGRPVYGIMGFIDGSGVIDIWSNSALYVGAVDGAPGLVACVDVDREWPTGSGFSYWDTSHTDLAFLASNNSYELRGCVV